MNCRVPYLSIILTWFFISFSYAGPLPGAIFTTLEDGSSVNSNIYESKEDVYLDGGPGINAPAFAAGLPEGDYFFQVTDPSGQDLLSTDHISCRKFHVNEHGVIDFIYSGTNYEWQQGNWNPVDCQHNQGTDQDHSELGAITVQLFPYDDTPNKGGVYKVWITPVERYTGDPYFIPVIRRDAVNGENYQPGNFHGFVPAWSKTDNYKVRSKGRAIDRILEVRKFNDANLNCNLDLEEPEISGWPIEITDPLGATNIYYTPVSILVSEGICTVTEITNQTAQTLSNLDGIDLSHYPVANPTVIVEYASNDVFHEVLFGNVALSSINVCKFYDYNQNQVWDPSEAAISGWRFSLTGVTLSGEVVGPILGETDNNGCLIFDNLLPGNYTVQEIIATTGTSASWVPTGALIHNCVMESLVVEGVLTGVTTNCDFGNICILQGVADFGTKGYWHNKNGLAELTLQDISQVNALLPYSSPSEYFDSGDEPFDGFFSDGTPVSASHGILGETLASEGTYQSEVSQFLVESVNGVAREQLAQQLLAFIFNVQHRTGGFTSLVQLPNGDYVVSGELINTAIQLWATGSDVERVAIKDLLDLFNNNDAVPFFFVYPGALPVIYP